MRPNVLFILTDQMRGDCLSASGHPVVQTPHLDRLARRGVNFTASYSCCPSCIAARASLFTGLRPTTHGRLGYRDGVPWRYERTLPGELSRAGYQTHCVGKTHFFPQRAHLGFEGLESYEAALNFDGRYVNDYAEWLRDVSGGRVKETDHGLDWNSWRGGVSLLPEEWHNNTWVVSRGIEFLRRRDPTRPFFLNLSFHRPHAPLDPPREWYERYAERAIPPPPVGDWAQEHDVPVTDENAWHGRLPAEQLAVSRRAYYAQIAHIDHQVGRFLAALEEHQAGPTWVIFTSDHGEMLGDHHLFRKTYAYEGSARTPLILCPPDGAPRHVSDAVVSQEDFMPTILEIAGAAVPHSVEGRSLLPLLAGAPQENRWRECMHGEHSRCYGQESGMQFLTDGREKYIWYPKTGAEQFFDLASDREELHDGARDPSRRDRLVVWRTRMAAELAPRVADGFSDGRRLIPGRDLPAVRPGLLA